MGPFVEKVGEGGKMERGKTSAKPSSNIGNAERLHAVMNVLCRRLLSIVLLNPAQAIAQQSI